MHAIHGSRLRIGALILALTSGICFGAPFKIGVLLKDKTPGFWIYADRWPRSWPKG